MTTTVAFRDLRLPAKFWNNVQRSTNGCWHWTGRADPKTNYGSYWVNGQGHALAHRHAFHVLVEQLVPRGQEGHLQVDHECHNRSKSCQGGPTCRHRLCVNPAHLRAVTANENLSASRHTVASKNRAMTECPQGHPLAGDNLGEGTDGRRYCKQCQVERTSENRRQRRAAERGDNWSKVEWNSKKTHCPQGHPYEGENLYVKPDGGRGCRTCRNAAARRHAEKTIGGEVPRGSRADWTECPKGHPLDGDNVKVDPKSGKRSCRQCKREREAARYAAKKAAG